MIIFLLNNSISYYNLKKENNILNDNYTKYNKYIEDINIYDNISNNYNSLIIENLSLEENKKELDTKLINLNNELNLYNSKIKELNNEK